MMVSIGLDFAMEVKRDLIQSYVNGLCQASFLGLHLYTERHHSLTIALICVLLVIYHRMVCVCGVGLGWHGGCCLTLQLLVAATDVKHNNCSERAFKSGESNYCPNGDKNMLDLPVVAHVRK